MNELEKKIKNIIKGLEDSLPNVGARDLTVEDFNNDDYFFGQYCAKSDAIYLYDEDEYEFLLNISTVMDPEDPKLIEDLEPFSEGYNDQAWSIIEEIRKAVKCD